MRPTAFIVGITWNKNHKRKGKRGTDGQIDRLSETRERGKLVQTGWITVITEWERKCMWGDYGRWKEWENEGLCNSDFMFSEGKAEREIYQHGKGISAFMWCMMGDLNTFLLRNYMSVWVYGWVRSGGKLDEEGTFDWAGERNMASAVNHSFTLQGWWYRTEKPVREKVDTLYIIHHPSTKHPPPSSTIHHHY